MAYQVLARKYRPQRFDEVIGQPHVTRTLTNALQQGRIAHGYIFSGHRGIGKTTIARILAMALNCRGTDGKMDRPVAEPCGVCDSCVEVREGRSLDVVEIDAATNRGIDEIRELREAARYRPARDRFKIYILDEAHQITDAAFNALLKTLEEPPSHVVFMMATTQPEDIPQTIRSRSQHYSFHAVKFDDIVAQLRAIAGQEGIAADDAALGLLAEAGDGSMRDALSIMDQAIACCGTRLTADVVRQLVGAIPSETLEDMMGAIARNASEDVLRLVDRLITEGQSPTHFARQLVRFLRNATVAKIAGGESPLLQVSADERARVARVAEQFSEEDLARFLQIMLRTHSELGWRQEQRFHLELGLLKLVHAQRLLPLEQLLSQSASGAASNQGVSRSPSTGRTVPNAPAPTQKPAPRGPSPFEQDRARKTASANDDDTVGGPRSPSTGPRGAADQARLDPNDRAPSPFRRDMSSSSAPQSGAGLAPQAATGTATALAEAPEPDRVEAGDSPAVPRSGGTGSLALEDLQQHVLAELQASNQNATATLLETAEWKLDASELTIQLPRPQAVVEMLVGADARRAIIAAAATALGHPVRLKVVGGGASNGGNGTTAAASRPAPTGSASARAADDPVVRRMQEKFGAEIRTVIDHRKR